MLNLQKLNLMVEPNKSLSTFIAFNVSLTAGLLDEQALPADTYIPLSSRACNKTSLLTPEKLALTIWGAPLSPFLLFIVTPSMSLNLSIR